MPNPWPSYDNATYPGGGRGSEGTLIKNQWSIGVQVRKIKKYV